MEKEIFKHIPKKLPEGMTPDDALMIIQNNLEFNIVDGKEQVKKNGAVLKTSDTRENINFQSAISDFSTERKWRGAIKRGKERSSRRSANGHRAKDRLGGCHLSRDSAAIILDGL